MTDTLISFFVHYTYILILVLFFIKIILFLTFKTDRWTIHHFLYFSYYNMAGTENVKRKKKKKIQNGLSVLIAVLIVVQVVIIFYDTDMGFIIPVFYW